MFWYPLWLKCQSNIKHNKVGIFVLHIKHLWTFDESISILMCSLNERVIKTCLINSEEITLYRETLTLFVGDKGASSCGAIQISGSRVQWVFQRRSGGRFICHLVSRAPGLLCSRSCEISSDTLSHWNNWCPPLLSPGTHTGQRPSWITRRERTLTQTHTRSQKNWDLSFLDFQTLTWHATNPICVNSGPSTRPPSTTTTKTAIRVDSSQENTYLTHCRNLP